MLKPFIFVKPEPTEEELAEKELDANLLGGETVGEYTMRASSGVESFAPYAKRKGLRKN